MAFQPLRWIFSLLLAAWSLVVVAADEVSDIKSIPLRTHSLQIVRDVVMDLDRIAPG